MARTDVFLYTNASSPAAAVVASQVDTTAATFPDLVLGDAPEFNFYFTDGTASWPSWAGSGAYTVTAAIGWVFGGDDLPLAITSDATAITGGWAIRLPLNAGRIINELGAARVSQDYPVVRLWLQLRVTDSDGYPVTYALIRCNVRLRNIPATLPASDDPLPSGTQNVLANSDGTLSSPANFFSSLTSYSAQSNASGNTTASIGSLAILHTEVITVSGSGSTTRICILPTSGRIAGHRADVRFLLPATAAITIEVRNATSGGTLLLSAVSDGSGDDVVGRFYFDGSAWQSLGAQFAT